MTKLAEQGASGRSGTVPPPENRWAPGESGNPKGRPSAGATIRDWINILSAQELPEDELRRIARDKRLAWNKRTAAERMLRTLESGDLADLQPVLRGEKTLDEMRDAGFNTEIVKKMKVKNVKVGDGEVAIEREIELHDRGGVEFDRVVETTDGRPMERVQVSDVTPAVDLGELAERLAEMGWEPATMPAMLQAALGKRRAKVVESTGVEP